MTARRFLLQWTVLLALVVVGCDQHQPLEPALRPTPAASAAAKGGPVVNAPSNTAAVAVSDNRIDVSWQDNATKETGFEIHRSSSGPSGAFTLRAVKGANVVTFTDGGASVDPSTPYCYRVRAVRTAPNGTTYSGFSNAACAPAGDVQITVVTTGIDLDPDGYALTVDAVTPGGVVPVASTSLAINGTVTIAGLRAGSYYRITLGDMDSNCDLTSPNPVPVTVVAGTSAAVAFGVSCVELMPPAPPSPLFAESRPPGGIDIWWYDNSNNEDGFKIERCEGDGIACADADFTVLGTTSITQFWDFPPVFGIYYTYRVRGFNRAGDSAPAQVSVLNCMWVVNEWGEYECIVPG